MVSLRRRKLLGLCAGRSSFLTPLPRFFDNGTAPLGSTQNGRSVSVHPLPSDDAIQPEEKNIAKVGAGSSNVSASSSSKEQRSQPYPVHPQELFNIKLSHQGSLIKSSTLWRINILKNETTENCCTGNRYRGSIIC